MTQFLPILLAILVILIAALIKRKTTDNEIWPYVQKKPFITVPEQTLYFRLTKALPEHIILAQVNLPRFIETKNSSFKYYAKIKELSIDFLVCSKDFSITAAIELDDSSHNRTKQKERDEKKNKALKAAGIQLIRWNIKTLPDERKIQADIFKNKEIKKTDSPSVNLQQKVNRS